MEEARLADNKYMRWFCYFVMFELFLMGSGQELHVTSFLTVRMVNFIVAVAISLYCFMRTDDFPKTIFWFIGSFTVLLLLSYFIAIAIGAFPEYIMEDIKPLIYFYILLFYYYASSSEKVVEKAFNLLLLSAKIMTVLYLIYMVLTDLTGIIDYVFAYQALKSDSFLFRGVGSSFFYKGFIFLPIAAVGFFRRKQYIWLILVSAAIFFTYTRGLYLLLVFGLAVYYMRTRHVSIVKIVALALVLLCIYEFLGVTELFSLDKSFQENREESDITRVLIIEQVMDAITYWSFFIGHGFGYGIAERFTHMEISYMDIFHKQGIIGIAFWLSLMVAVIYYARTVSNKYKETADFWMTATLMIYLQSCFNPYINTPMGMTVVFMALVFCYRFSQDERFADSSPVQC